MQNAGADVRMKSGRVTYITRRYRVTGTVINMPTIFDAEHINMHIGNTEPARKAKPPPHFSRNGIHLLRMATARV